MDYYTVNSNFISDIHQGYTEDAKKLMEHELFDANFVGESGSSHLVAVAAARDNPKMIKALIDKGAEPKNEPDALFMAAHWGNLGNMAMLIDNGADVHLKAVALKTNNEKAKDWAEKYINSIEMNNKLNTELKEKDSYEEMMKKLGVEHKAKQEQTITRAGRTKM
ncbi:ankyrin repeat domain-containing protein [Burkholderia stagnalis]|uniref:Ankyrin repeat domain-containing protein n=1 Tax=Burkholderia stagnalis TaxID=1503054 RepID=A0A6L3N562_9BURK|nr:ankyrin repeat domain-containing protein [Burkholderia stagnalis]KAB0640692.1 ankyrin repeat domain-containing protein [Burkholderia stagnalis]VWB06629.1 hypothetical protein BST28156_00133 [Burkholderia stagnalis]